MTPDCFALSWASPIASFSSKPSCNEIKLHQAVNFYLKNIKMKNYIKKSDKAFQYTRTYG